MLEELTKMISNQPMSMSSMDGADEDTANDTALPASGFGGDWASALTKSFVDDAGVTGADSAGARGAGPSAAGISRAYTHLQPRR